MNDKPLTADDMRWTDNGQVTPPRVKTRPRSLAELEVTFARWIRDIDPVPTRAILATYVANQKLEGDPVWLMPVGGSGVGKTERITPLSGMPDVVVASSISGPAALLSGTARKDRAKQATGGLLRQVPDEGGVLVLKDFTSIIEMHREARAELLAALREIYDGQWSRAIGVDGGQKLIWNGRLGLIAGCTTAIDTAHAVISTMGARFMLVRIEGNDDLGLSALDHVGRELQMREELKAAVRGLLEHLPGAAYHVESKKIELDALGKFVARARSPVDRDFQNEIRLVLDPEAPTRLCKMLAQLWRASGLLGLDRDAAWELVLRVGFDSIPKLRLMVLDYLFAHLTTAPSTTKIAEEVDHPTTTTRRTLEDLTAHQILRRTSAGPGKADYWELTTKAKEWLSCLTFPVLSEDPIEHPLYRSKITYDDKTGKVRGNKSGPECEVV